MALYVKFDCATCENENCYGHGLPTTEKVCDGYKHTATNADRIRAMTDEELAEFIASGVPKDVCKDRCGGDESFPCSECVLDWLREEA